MKKMIKKTIATVLCVIMMLGIAPLNGLAEIDLPELHLPALSLHLPKIDFKLPEIHLNLPKISLPDFTTGFATKASAATSGTCGDNLTWELNTSTGVLIISGTGAMKNYSTNSVYNEYLYQNIRVTTAPWYSYWFSLGTVIIEEGVTSIGDNAFYSCRGISKVIIPSSVTRIGTEAFCDCENIAHLVIPNSVTSIGSNAFGKAYYNPVKSILYHGDIDGYTWGVNTAYPDYYYDNGIYYSSPNREKLLFCYSGSNIVIPDTVTTIDYYAFYNRNDLTSITIPESVTSIGSSAFSGCSGLKTAGPIGGGYDYEFGWTTAIPANAFSGCSSLLSIIIPESITSIGNSAFSGCKGLTSVTIPESVTSIGNSAFYGCTGLTEINYNATNVADLSSSSNVFYNAGTASNGIDVVFGNSVEKIPAYLFYVSGSNQRPIIKSVTIGNNVTSIGNSAFYGCSDLKSLTIPESVTSIGSSAFSGCSGLKTAGPIGGGYDYEFGWTTAIPANAFSGCSGLTSITIPESVTSIGDSAFYGCSSLSSITIPESVTSIGNSAFYGCTGLAEINYNATNVADLTSSSNVFYNAGTASNGIDVVFGNSVEKIPAYLFYVSGSNYRPIIKSVTIGNNVTNIGRSAFLCCSGLTSITIPDSVTSIGEHAFQKCGLTSITIPDSVTSIGDRAFSGCTGLAEINYNAINVADLTSSSNAFDNAGTASNGIDVVFGNSVEKIPAYLFYVSGSNQRPIIKSVTIGNNVTSIGNSAFYGCSDLKSLTIPESVTSIGSSAFSGCSGLKTAGPIGGGYDYEFGWTTAIPANAFSGCSGLTSITIPESVTSIGDSAFYGCSSLSSITIHESVTSIGSSAFSGCSGLKTAGPIGSGYDYEFGWTTAIPANAFSGCVGLTSITIPESVTSIGDSAFSGCVGLTSITIPESVTSIGDSAFYGCTGLTEINYNATNVADLTSSSNVFDNAGTASDGIDVVFGNSVERIPAYLFYVSDSNIIPNIKSVIIGDNVTSIGNSSFVRCSGLSSLTIPDSVTDIGGSAFSYCTGLTNLTIGNGVLDIGDYAFSNCYALKEVTIPDSVTSIGEFAFSGCYFESLTIGENVTTIGAYAFSSNTSLKEINYNAKNAADLPEDLFYISSARSCETIVTIGESVERIPANLFYVSSVYPPLKIKTVIIGSNVKSVGNRAFNRCNEITDIYYSAIPARWREISIGNYNTRIKNAMDYAYYDENADNAWIHFGTKNVIMTFDTAGGSEIERIIADAGTEITQPANPTKEGYTFAGWDKPIPVNMPGEDMTITALWTINQYTLSFDTDGGNEIGSITADYGTTISKPSDPRKTGYTFIGWNKDIPDTMPAHNMEFTALWSINSYQVIFNTAGGEELEPITLTFGTNVAENLPVPVRNGYTFTGWVENVPETMPDEDVTLTATWVKNHSVIFDTDGGTEIPAFSAAPGTTVPSVADPVKEGYTFAGWEPEIPETVQETDITVKAKWTINQYTITVNTDGGTPTVEPFTADFGTAISKPADPHKTGYTFLGWDMEFPATMPAENITINALYCINEHTITFDSDGGSDVESITQNYGTEIVKPADPTRTGFTFTGWNIDVPETMPDEDITLTAQWSRNKYKINYLDDDGSVLDVHEVYYDYDIPSYNASKTGYTFVGWDADIPEKMPANDLTFTSSWSINSYTLTFVFGNGTDNLEITQYYNTPITAPDYPTRTGYTFTGWNKDVPELMPAQNMTITARWSVNSYTVIYYDQLGDSVLGTRTYNYGSTVYAPGSYYKSGYMLKGWVWPDGKDAKPETMPAYNIKAYAIWVTDDGAHSGHDIRIVGSVAPTCTTDGFSGRSFCNTCNKGIDNGYTLPAYGHDNVNTIQREAACEEAGIRTCVCNFCGYRTEEAIPATGHSRTSEAITTEPTCTETGVRTITCHCGYSWTETVPANGHNYDDVIDYVPASCGQEGYVIKKCTECDSTTREAIKALEHNYVTEPAVDPTCTEDGHTLKKYCTLCGKVEIASTVTPALGHDYQNYVLSEANCTDTGRYIKICSRCKCVEADANGEAVQTTTNVVVPSSKYPESAHNYSNNMSKTYSFDYPGATELILKFSSSTRFETGYDYLYIYDSNGTQLGRYSGTQLSGTTIRVPGSSFSLKLTSDSSSTYYGFRFDSITALSYNYENAKVYTQAALGHDYSEITTVESTCQATGEYVKKCNRCGEYEKANEPVFQAVTADSSTYPETPHNYKNDQVYEYDFTYPNAKGLTLTFSQSCMFETDYDFLTLYDASGNEYGRYTGNQLQGKKITLNGDSFSIKVETDFSTNYYGFSIDSIVAQADISVKKYTKPKAPHNYSVESIVKPATPLETGLLTHICSVCGYSETLVIPKTLYGVGEVISYGSYPQSKVTNKNLISQLSAQPATWKSYGYYTGDGGVYNGHMAPNDFMRYTDVTYNGVKYRGVTFSGYRMIATGGTPAALGDYSLQDDYGYYKNKVYWFRYDPLQWRVLDPTKGLVVSEKAIDSQAFSNFVITSWLETYGDSSYSHYANNWQYSSIRNWLNNDFYNTAFTSAQKANVLPTDIRTLNYTTLRGERKSHPYDSASTTDKVFLLSYEDILNIDYSFSESPSASDDRIAYGTDYARCQGLGVRAEEISAWYLRTSANDSDRVCLVSTDGSIETDNAGNESFVGTTVMGIRPALRLGNISATGGASSSNQLHTVTYQIGGNTLGTLQIAQGDPIVLLHASAPAGYSFSGWSEPQQMPGEDITLTGEYLPIYKATFKADGVTVGTVDYTTASTAIIEPKLPEKEGYTGHWEEYSFTAGGITVNAVYEKDGEHVHSYTEFTTKQPTCTQKGEKTFTCSCGDSYTGEIPALGHSFTHYVYNNDATTEKDGTETAKCDRCTATDTRTAVGTRIIPNVYILTYDANGGTGAPARQNGNGNVTLSSTRPTKDGYSFLGWAESASATSAKYQPGATYNLKANATLYAVWKKIDTPVNPTANAKINVAGSDTLSYRTKVTIRATASNLDSAYHLVLVVNGKEYHGNNVEVSSDTFELKSDVNYYVKIVDSGNRIQKDASGSELKKDGGTIKCNAGFFQKLIAFFQGLFNALPEKKVQPK